MKPMGAIPAEFRGEVPLVIAGRSVEHWVAAAGDTPLEDTTSTWGPCSGIIAT